MLRRLHADRGRAGRTAGLGLHFDLTVPFARYVVENAGQLAFPFRRYQIQKVWRGERPQEGRYREFYQADIDVVGAGELPFHHDVEIAQVMTEALRPPAAAAGAAAAEQPPVDRGVLPRPGRPRRPRGDEGRRQAGQDLSGRRGAAAARRAPG